MNAVRKNTLVVDFDVLPVRPSAGIIKQFLDEKLKLDIGLVKNLQLHTIRNCVLIELCSLDAAESMASTHHLKHTIVSEMKSFNIPVYVEDSAINVRILDLPPAVPNAVVAEHMQQYGKVKSVARELWKKFFPGVPNGVRVVRIELAKHVPSFIQIANHVTTVTYRSQIATCRHCQRKAHPKKKCSEVLAEDKGNQTINKESPIAHCEADNQMEESSEMDAELQQREQQKKRSVRSTATSATSSINSPPRKKQITRAVEHDYHRTTNEKIDAIVSDVDSDSDSGPDPAKDDIDGWVLKLTKRSRKQDKRIAKVLNAK